MGNPKRPRPVKLFVGAILNPRVKVAELRSILEDQYGTIDLESPEYDFDFTDYYAEQMGEGLIRKFFSFRGLIDPGTLPETKLSSNDLEEQFPGRGDYRVTRPINLDPGYLGLSKLVLATTKNYAHRIYLRKGIYAEVTLRYRGDGFEPFSWTYPDFRTPDYLSFFNQLRSKYKRQLDEPEAT